MSTDHQKYSTENQLDVIRKYAETRGLTILRTFEDSGRSGLRLDGREALQNLMAEVQSGQADFKAILVYDVSRWGRFQDADEGAYHEHVCSRAGIRVHYCGEQFENDGSIGSNLLKTVKRVMAGEYSRELSVKVFAGQCRLVELGYRQGGAAGYGLRRVLIDEHGNPKGELSRGEQKSLQTDRVILVPGPEEEQRVVKRMYEMFVNEGRPEREIAEVLNAEGHRTDLDRPWTRATVHQVLTNEKYIGNNVFNKVSFKLKQRRVVNPRDMWIRAEGAFAAIVDKALFLRAREIVDARSRHFSDEELLDALRAILKRQGMLSGLIIDEEDDLPSSSAYRSRFGSLLRAYRLIGYEPVLGQLVVEMLRCMGQEVAVFVNRAALDRQVLRPDQLHPAQPSAEVRGNLRHAGRGRTRQAQAGRSRAKPSGAHDDQPAETPRKLGRRVSAHASVARLQHLAHPRRDRRFRENRTQR
jgi:DNA invertase Pin-like site-specific DNA recombinase